MLPAGYNVSHLSESAVEGDEASKAYRVSVKKERNGNTAAMNDSKHILHKYV